MNRGRGASNPNGTFGPPRELRNTELGGHWQFLELGDPLYRA